MDGSVFIKVNKEGLEGKYLPCKIIDVAEYDLIGELI